MKWFICLLVIVLPSIVSADCITVMDTVMYFNPERFLLVDRVAAVNPAQGLAMMKEDVVDGTAVFVKERTKIRKVEAINAFIGIAEINNQLLVCVLKSISCK